MFQSSIKHAEPRTGAKMLDVLVFRREAESIFALKVLCRVMVVLTVLLRRVVIVHCIRVRLYRP